MNSLSKAIFATLAYHDIFDYPMKEQEIWRFLVYNSKLKSQSYRKILRALVDKDIIGIKNSFYFLLKREKIISIRKQRKKYSQEKIKIAKRTVKLLKIIPWIKMVGITGALAMNNSGKNDDIDFLIITKLNRLWLTRFCLLIILFLLGRRRKPKDKDFKNKICLNLFLDESALSIFLKKRNLFTAHEICQTKPIFDKEETYAQFLKANLWVEKYLPNGIPARYVLQDDAGGEIKKLRNLEIKDKNIKNPNILISSRCLNRDSVQAIASPGQYLNIFDFLDKIAYLFQLRYMKAKRTVEDVNSHFAFFHPRDRTKEILKKYYKQEKKIY